jgi:ribosomal protein S18 acetylase RimI-like enzyme
MSDSEADELAAGELEIDKIPVRRLGREDLDAVVRIDQASTGIGRRDFYRAKLDRALEDSSVQLSLAAELDGMTVGFLFVTFYYGEFGMPETVAVIEAIGVHPEYRGRQVARALMRQLEMNLGALGVETVRTEVGWDQLELLQFLAHFGFEPAPRFCLQKRL